jgi:uncharacterized protein YdhG (YjbR/CyaY superfamily)
VRRKVRAVAARKFAAAEFPLRRALVNTWLACRILHAELWARCVRRFGRLCRVESIEVISYGIPAFKHDVVLVWYAAFADHCSLFPTAAVIEKFKKELKGFSISKGTIRFPLSKPLPIALIKKLVKARVARAS